MAFIADVGRVGSAGASGAFASVRRALHQIADFLADRRMRSAAEAELRSMTDRELADIGVTRSEIQQRVWRS
jgi:uncharacterized protein YjiS (DUF1127 family)